MNTAALVIGLLYFVGLTREIDSLESKLADALAESQRLREQLANSDDQIGKMATSIAEVKK